MIIAIPVDETKEALCVSFGRAPYVLFYDTEQEQGQVEKFAALLDSISPLKLLSQGYSITSRGAEVLTDASALRPGEQINTRLARGWVLSQVLETNAEDQVGAR